MCVWVVCVSVRESFMCSCVHGVMWMSIAPTKYNV